MADAVDRPKDDGAIKLPSLAPGMNKRRPTARTDYDDPKRLGANDNRNSPKKDEAILDELRKLFERIDTNEADNRNRAKLALTFQSGKQWSDADSTQRNIDQRPCLTVDRLGPIIRQVTNDQRLNRPSIQVSPIGDRGDPEAAKMFRGLIRAIERDCAADIAYDWAFENAVATGWGYIRVNTEYESETSFNQVLVIKRVRNKFTVYGDPDAHEPDGADWTKCIISELVPTEEYKETWPKAQLINWELASTGDKFKMWFTKDGVRIAEFWKVCKEPRTLVKLSNGHTGWKDELHDSVVSHIEDGNIEVIEERESFERSIKWFKTNGVEILERGEWLGKWIPIVPVYGNELDMEGKLRLSGIIEPAMDAQRMANYWRTKYAEGVALAPMAKWLIAEGQNEGYEDQWRNANKVSDPTMTYRPTSFGGASLPPPIPIPPPGIPQGFEHGAEMADMDIMATTGIRFDVAQDRRNVDARSGKAIREFNRPQDVGTAHYIDNFKRSLKHLGDILIDLIPKYYDEKRQLMILREDDTEEKVEIDPHSSKPVGEKQGANGKKLPTFNPTIGKYGVTVTIGPSYATKRIESREDMLSLLQALPHIGQVAGDLIVKNFDFEDVETLTKRLLMTLPPGMNQPDQKDMTPQVQALVQQMQTQIKTLQQGLQLAQKELQDKGADRQIAENKIDKDYEAKILKIIADASKEAAKIAVMEAKLHLEGHKAEHGEHIAERQQDLAEHPPKEKKANA